MSLEEKPIPVELAIPGHGCLGHRHAYANGPETDAWIRTSAQIHGRVFKGGLAPSMYRALFRESTTAT